MNIQNRMDSSLMMDRAVRKERQKLRSHTKSYRVSGQGADNSKLYDKLISKNQDADKTGTDMLVKRSRYYSISEISKEVSKKAEELLKEPIYFGMMMLDEYKEKDIDKSDEQTQKEWEEDVTSFLALHNTLLNSLKRIDTDVMTKYAKELQSNAKEYEKALEEMGIVIDDSGAFSISKEGLVQSDNEKWQEFVKKTQALSKETQTSAKSSLDSITTNRILHGISYNKYGKES